MSKKKNTPYRLAPVGHKTNCPTCGVDVTVAGEGMTHYYIPKSDAVEFFTYVNINFNIMNHGVLVTGGGRTFTPEMAYELFQKRKK